jgi:hypothetical protein
MVGSYIVSFSFGTLFALPVSFKTNFPYTALTVSTSPAYSTSPTSYGTYPTTALSCQLTGTLDTTGAVIGYGATVYSSNARLKTGVVASNDYKYNA